MDIDFINGGILSYILPAALLVCAIMAMAQLFRGRFTGVITLAVFGAIVFFGFNFYAGSHDTDALKSAISQRYGLSVTDAQANELNTNHSYRRHAPDATVSTTQGTAKPYGTVKVSLHAVKREVMMYQVRGRWYIGSVPAKNAANQKVRELPVSDAIPSLN